MSIQVSFGNLNQPKHTNNPDKPEAEDKLSEMMEELHKAGFKRVTKTADVENEPKSYHIYELPHKITFSSHGKEAVKIMEKYSDYMQPLALEAVS